MDVHPVILAGGQGAGLYPLNECCPKALLPVGNHPLIYYPLKLLETNKFREVTVVVNSRDVKAMTLALDGFQRASPESNIKFLTFELPDSEEAGSATALIALKSSGRVKSDLLVISCDVIANISLHHLWEMHVSTRAAVSLLLVNPLPSTTDDSKRSRNTEQDLIGLTDRGQVVFHSSLADVDDELKLSKRMLNKTPHFKMYSNLLDSHVYILNKWVLDYMAEHLKSCLSFKREVLPHLIRNKESKALVQLAEGSQDSIEQWALRCSSNPIPSSRPVQCYAHTISGQLCMRVNTVPSYMEANRMIFQHFPSFLLERTDSLSTASSTKSTAISGDSIVGDGVQLSEKSSVKRSMIGRHCVIGEKVKVINSVVMDHVVIGESCTVQNTILCSHVRLEEKVTLRDCTVGPRVTINSKAEHKGELMVEESEIDF